jgi:hypothetical protein
MISLCLSTQSFPFFVFLDFGRVSGDFFQHTVLRVYSLMVEFLASMLGGFWFWQNGAWVYIVFLFLRFFFSFVLGTSYSLVPSQPGGDESGALRALD